jgi:RecB family exonuclease
VLPEITIKGMATLNNQIFKVIGRMDMVVIKPNGEVNIVDYKCSPKEYADYDTAKVLTFNY